MLQPALVFAQSHNHTVENCRVSVHHSICPLFAEPHKPSFSGHNSHAPVLGLGNTELASFDGVVGVQAGDRDGCVLALVGHVLLVAEDDDEAEEDLAVFSLWE